MIACLEESIAGRQSEQICDLRIVLLNVASTYGREEIVGLRPNLTTPEIPTACVSLHRMPEAVYRNLTDR